MTLKQTFPVPPPSFLINYSYPDISDGTGNIIFYGYSSKEDTTTDYHLHSVVLYSNDIVTSASTISASFVKVVDNDHDIKFNVPQDIKGTIRVVLSVGMNSGTDVGHGVYAIVKIRHWDGSTETEIASAQTETQTWDGGTSEAQSKTMNLNIPITTNKHFSKDQTFRVTVEIWGKSGNGMAGVECGYGIDPKDRNDDRSLTGSPPKIIDDDHTKQFEIHIPTRIKK